MHVKILKSTFFGYFSELISIMLLFSFETCQFFYRLPRILWSSRYLGKFDTLKAINREGIYYKFLLLFLRPCLIHARMPELGRAFVHGHTFLHSWSGPMRLVVGLLDGATFLSNLPLFLFVSFIIP